MALSKSITLPSGVTGSYIRISAFRWDRNAKEASVLFDLFLDAATAAKAGSTPVAPTVAKLRLVGTTAAASGNLSQFDTYIGAAAVDVAQLYTAAKQEAAISDFGPTILHGAADA